MKASEPRASATCRRWRRVVNKPFMAPCHSKAYVLSFAGCCAPHSQVLRVTVLAMS